MDKRDVSETMATADVIRSVLEDAPGKSPDEVRSMLISGLRARGIEPSNEALEVYRSVIAEKLSSRGAKESFRAGSGHRRGHSLLSASPARLIRNARAMRRMLPQYQPSTRTSFMAPDRTLAPLAVILDPSARQWLVSADAKLPRGADPSSRIDVWLDFSDSAGTGSIRVHLRDRLIGYLQAQHNEIFESAIQDARAAKETLMTSGYIEKGHGSEEITFYVYQPLTGFA
jgi:hypothetical protein